MAEEKVQVFAPSSYMPEEEQSKRTDPFEIGIDAMELATIVAIVYAMIAFPMWLKPAAL